MMASTHIKFNKKWDTIEIIFGKKPTAKVLSQLRASAFKWAPVKKQWWAKNTAKNKALASILIKQE